MRILVDMNLSPRWIPVLREAGHDAVHWSSTGRLDAPDDEILAWARAHDHCVLTHDLDLTTILARTAALGPSVLQVRTQDVLPDAIGPLVLRAIDRFADELTSGAVVTIDVRRVRARVLPLRR